MMMMMMMMIMKQVFIDVLVLQHMWQSIEYGNNNNKANANSVNNLMRRWNTSYQHAIHRHDRVCAICNTSSSSSSNSSKNNNNNR